MKSFMIGTVLSDELFAKTLPGKTRADARNNDEIPQIAKEE